MQSTYLNIRTFFQSENESRENYTLSQFQRISSAVHWTWCGAGHTENWSNLCVTGNCIRIFRDSIHFHRPLTIQTIPFTASIEIIHFESHVKYLRRHRPFKYQMSALDVLEIHYSGRRSALCALEASNEKVCDSSCMRGIKQMQSYVTQ